MKRNGTEELKSISAIIDFTENNPDIATRSGVISFDAMVLWKIMGAELYDEYPVRVRWDHDGYKPYNVIIEARRPDNSAGHFHTVFSPEFQFYFYDDAKNVLRIKDADGFYEVVVSAYSVQTRC